MDESEKAHAKTKAELEALKARQEKLDAEESKTSIASSEADDLSPGNGTTNGFRVPGAY